MSKLNPPSIGKTETPTFGSKEYRDFFRETYISTEGKWKFLGIKNGRLYLSIILLVAISTPILLANQITEFKAIYFLLIPIYFLICNLFEYVLHRYPMHHKIKFFESISAEIRTFHVLIAYFSTCTAFTRK